LIDRILKSEKKTSSEIIKTPQIVEKLYTQSELDAMTIDQLKNLMTKVGLSYELSKGELIDRILKAKVKKAVSKSKSQSKGSPKYKEEELKKKRVVSLVEILKRRKLKAAGRKSQMVKRILDNQEKILGPVPVSSI